MNNFFYHNKFQSVYFLLLNSFNANFFLDFLLFVFTLNVHKRETFVGSDFEFGTFCIRGTKLSLYSVCAELSYVYTQYARNFVRLILNMRGTELSLNSVCAELCLAYT